MTTSVVGLKLSHPQKSHQTTVNPRDIAGNAEEEEEYVLGESREDVRVSV